MRIIAGEYRGRRLTAPSGRDTRPTSDRVREALFSSLHSRIGSFAELRVLDAYAGSGALGFEALSRGATHVTAVEHDKGATRVIQQNLDTLLPEKATPSYRLIPLDALKAVPLLANAHFDIAFFDPPYGDKSATIYTLLRKLAEAGALAIGALVVVERAASDDGSELWPKGFAAQDVKVFGDTSLHFAVYGVGDER